MASKTQMKRRARGEGGLIKRRNHYYLRQLIGGKRIEIPLNNKDGSRCTTEAQAKDAVGRMDRSLLELDTQERLVEKVAEIRQLKVVYQAKSSDVWQLYLNSSNRPDTGVATLAEQQKLLERFGDWMQEHYHSGIDGTTPAAASAYMHEIGEQISNRTFDGYAATLKLIFKTVYKQLGMPANPFDDIRRRPLETISRHEFTAEQVQRIFDGFRDGFYYETEVEGLGPGRKRIREKKRLEYTPLYKDEMEVLFKMCCFTGSDGQSGCLMKWESIDLDGNKIHYVRHKTRKKTNGLVITLPIHPLLRDALHRALDWRQPDNPYILPNVAARYKRNRCGIQKDTMKIIRCALGLDTTDKSAVNYKVDDDSTGKGKLKSKGKADGDKKAVPFREDAPKRRLGANVYSLHSFRHTFVSFCVNAGVPTEIVAAIVGHGNPVMTRHYAHVNDDAKQSAIDVLPMLSAHEDSDASDAPEANAAEELRQRLLSYINTASTEQLVAMAQLLPPVKAPLTLSV